MNRIKLYSFAAMVILVVSFGCSTIKPAPEAAVEAPPPPAPADDYPLARLIAELLGGMVK